MAFSIARLRLQKMETQQKSDETKEISLEQLETRISYVRKTILTLEWDKKHNQIHVGMEERYHRMKEEYEILEKQLAAMRLLEKDEPVEEAEEPEEEEEKEKDDDMPVLDGIEELEGAGSEEQNS